MANELTESIKANAAGPKAATGDSSSVTQHGLREQIEADRYVRETEHACNPWGAVGVANRHPRPTSE